MENIFLTSSVNISAEDIAKRFNIKGKLVFITTASEPKSESDLTWQDDDRNALIKARFDVFDYTITGKKEEDITEDLKNVDIVYVSGGNSFYLLEKVKESHFDKIVKNFVAKGKIYIGTSAGSIVAGPDIFPVYYLDSAKEAKNLKDYKGIGLVDFTVLPHWGSEHFRERYLKQRLEHVYKDGYKLILLNDNQYVAVEGNKYRIIDITKD
ncbi:MAG: Type 1 glutamine amidotransferase-like domain-containing protein [Patescibacteria group bacterium]|nr:Type 1 glutamine amidotransferase-like domain-containing protein [Patescibacteria group bacterium]MDD5294883.1 Type 1 glutamine amidotransferase-like domain-containing protein [Patescibacteria group bacterium]MDD5554865.1 Type 1 glutamine amidotransferase-like domain-containing protein [Patescibacteria group bacterium]